METIAKMIDHTLLKQDASEEQIRKLCREAAEYGFASVCINPCYVPVAASELTGTDVKVCTVIGFPLGASESQVKAFEAKTAIASGAEEVDMVINVGLVKSGKWDAVQADIQAVVDAAREAEAEAEAQGIVNDAAREAEAEAEAQRASGDAEVQGTAGDAGARRAEAEADAQRTVVDAAREAEDAKEVQGTAGDAGARRAEDNAADRQGTCGCASADPGAVPGHIIVKVIIETCLLTDEEKERACIAAKAAGADFVKTSTGFSTGGATPEDVALMRRIVGSDMGIKAAGGIHTAEEARAMIEAGATRIGASAGIAIVRGWK